MFGEEGDVHFGGTEHHDRFGIEKVSQGIGMAFVVDPCELPCLFVDGEGDDGIDLFFPCQIDCLDKGGIAVASTGGIDFSRLDGERIGNFLDGLEILRNRQGEQRCRLLQHPSVDTVDRIDFPGDRMVVSECQFDADTIEVTDRDCDAFHHLIQASIHAYRGSPARVPCRLTGR